MTHGQKDEAERIVTEMEKPTVKDPATLPDAPDKICLTVRKYTPWGEIFESKMVQKLGPPKQLRVCYEAGPTGYVLYWQLTALGVDCQVIAPSLTPVKAG